MFKKLKNYYDFLEKDMSFKKNFGLSSQLSILRDNIDNDDDKKKCSFEIFFNDLMFIDGKYVPLSGIYPSLSLFDDFEYIKLRSLSNNPKYKAKYNHLLWVSPQKHIKYARLAIENYLTFLKTVNIYEKDNISNKGFSEIFRNLFFLSQIINHKKDEVVNFLISLLNGEKLNGYQKYSLMEYISKEGKKNKKETLETFFNYSNNIINNEIYPEFTGEFLKLSILLSNKLKLSPKEFHNKLGDFHIESSKKHKGSFVVHSYYLKALKEFQKASNKDRIEKTTILIEKAKNELNFTKTKTEIEMPELQIWLDELKMRLTDFIEKKEAKIIYEYLINSKEIFPEAKELTENNRPIMLDLVSTINFDINKNVSNDENSGINSYYIHITNLSMRYLWFIFYIGFNNDKVNFKTLKEYIENNTWFGQTINSKKANGENESFKWSELLLPSLEHYFTQTEIDIKTQSNSNYILSIDGLVIKFEGVLREFSRMIGAQTIELKDNGTQERISFEKMLDNEKLIKIIPKNDIALFKYLFTKKGMNLRNNIAHSFYKPKNYTAAVMWLLISAFLKLGNYKININSA